MHSQLLMASGFLAAILASLATRRYGLALIYTLAAAEVFAQLRYPFHVAVRDSLLGGSDDQTAKMALQTQMLWGAALAGAALLALILPLLLRRLGKGARLVLCGNLILCAMLAVELISLHWIDALIYHPVLTFAPCAFVYFGGAVLVTAGVLADRHRRHS